MAALVKAIEQKRFKQVELLLQLGDSVNQREKRSGTTPLLATCFLEDEKLACRMAKKLLNRGADVCLPDNHGMSPLMQACRLGKEKLVQEFIQTEECDFGAADFKGNTALIHSIEAGNSRITKVLTEAMNIYDVRAADKPNKNGETPLIRAIKLKRTECKEVLLSDGNASPSARDFDLRLNAREWELYLNEREDKVKNMDLKEGNLESSKVNRKQKRNHYERSRAKSSIINCSQDLTNTSPPSRHSVSYIEKNNFDDKVLRRRTKSAPLVKGENGSLVAGSVKCHFEPMNKEKSVDKWALSTKTNVCVTQKSLYAKENLKQNGVPVATAAAGCYNKHEPSPKLEQEREGLVTKGVFTSSTPLQQKMRQHPIERYKRETALSSHQKQLPQLFSLMTQQTTHSFRSPAKERTPEEKPIGKRQASARKESSKRMNPRRGSLAMIRQNTARRRWSTAIIAAGTIARFSSLYSRSNFKVLNPDNPSPMLNKPSPGTRRRSVQSIPEGLGFSTSKKERNISPLSHSLVELEPAQLSHSLPDKSSVSRVKSSKPRTRLYARHNSDSSISTGNLLSRLSKTPVIEETEEVPVNDG